MASLGYENIVDAMFRKELEYHLVVALVNVISAAQTTSMFTQTPLLSIHLLHLDVCSR